MSMSLTHFAATVFNDGLPPRPYHEILLTMLDTAPEGHELKLLSNRTGQRKAFAYKNGKQTHVYLGCGIWRRVS